MSTQSFKIKNNLHLTPQAVEPSGLEVGDLWMDIQGNLKRWDGSASQDVGSGGVGSVDIMFAQTMEQAVIGDFTVAGSGTVSITESVLEVLQGDKSLKIAHGTGANTTVQELIDVPVKYRNKNVTMSLDIESDATSGNLTLTVRDMTNSADLVVAEALQPQEANQTSVKRSVSFNVPATCEQLRYTITAVSESGKISIIDNVVIELTQTAKLSTTIEVPKKEYVLLKTVGTFTNSAGIDTLIPFSSISSSSDLYNISANGTSIQYGGTYLIKLKGETGANNELVTFKIEVNGVKTSGLTQHLLDANPSGSNSHFEDSFIVNLKSGDVVKGYILNPNIRSNRSFELHIEQINSDQESQEVSLAQTVLKQESDDVLHVAGVLGYGSTNTRVVRFDSSSIQKSLGDAITYIPSATLGDSFKINEAGVYQINATVGFQTTTGNAFPYIVKNPTNLAQSAPSSIPINEVVSHAYPHGGASGNPDIALYANVYLEKDDVIWVTNPVVSPVALNTGNRSYIQITKQGSLKQVNVSENQKIEIPTSELRMEGASTRGTGSDSAIVRFDNIAKLRGDAFTVDSTAALGTVITMKKKGKLDINLSLNIVNGNNKVQITLNQSTRTNASSVASEILADTHLSSASNLPPAGMTATVFVNIGDVIRVASTIAPVANVGNSLNLSFQEQEVAVSVTNVLPQFSESDSSVRVDTANGYGSGTGFTACRRFSNNSINLGSAITYVDSPTEGAIFTINEDAEYAISYSEMTNAATAVGIARNPTTGGITSQSANSKLAMSTVPTANFDTNVAWQGRLQKGDVIKAITDGAAAGIRPSDVSFTISKVGKPNVTGVDVTPFAKIEYEVTEQLSAQNGSSPGSGTSLISNFSSLSNSGSILQQSSSRLTALKDCEVSISWSWLADSSVSNTVAVSLYKNGALYSNGGNANNQTYVTSAATTVLLRTGEYVELYKFGSIAGCSSVRYTATVTDIRNAYQVIGGGVENTYSARINNNGSLASIVSQSYPFIQSVTRNSIGNITINLVPGFYTQVPNVLATVVNSAQTGADRVAQVYSVSTSSIGILTNGNGGLNDYDVSIVVQRQGSDYRTPSKAIGLPQQRVAIIKDVKAAGTAGGTSVTSYTARVLNTLQDPTGIVQNSTSFTGTGGTNTNITLNAGTYRIEAYASVYGGTGPVLNQTKLKLRNITDSTDAIIGTVVAPATPSGDAQQIIGKLVGIITLTSQKTFELQQRVSTGVATQGLGLATNFGDVNIFADVVIEKLEE